MKAKTIILASLVFLLSFSFCLGAQEENTKKKSVSEKGVKSLIRKDLLLKKRKNLGSPRRNIFSPSKSEGKNTKANPTRLERSPEELKALITDRASSMPLNIRYVGYIVSGKKIVALIIFRGAILTVEQGEIIAEGMEVGKITPVEIEVIGSDSAIRKYPLEGEDK